jgi:hypothetical protein
VTFTTRRDSCPPVHINDVQIPQENHVKYLGLHLDRHLTWRAHTHIFSNRKQLGLSLTKMYWLLGRKSKLSITNKLLIYKVILKPIWTYGIQLWGTTSNSNIGILERFQPKVRNDLQIPTVKEEIADSAPITMFASVYTPMNSSAHSPSCQSKGACVDTGPTTCFSDSSSLY